MTTPSKFRLIIAEPLVQLIPVNSYVPKQSLFQVLHKYHRRPLQTSRVIYTDRSLQRNRNSLTLRIILILAATFFLFARPVLGQEKVNANILRTIKAPLIDGIEDNLWSSTNAVFLTRYGGAVPQTVTGTWKALWNDTAFFVFISVVDDDFYPAYVDLSSEPWLYDRCEVYLDVNDILMDGLGPEEGNSGHWQVAPNLMEGMDGNGAYLNLGWEGHIPATSVAYTVDGSNYNMEICIPFHNLSDKNGVIMNSKLLVAKTIGFDVRISDRDRTTGTSISAVGWQELDPYTNMDNCGTITCVGGSGFSDEFVADFFEVGIMKQLHMEFKNEFASDITLTGLDFTKSKYSTSTTFPLLIKAGEGELIQVDLDVAQHDLDRSAYAADFTPSGSNVVDTLFGNIETAVFMDDNSEIALAGRRAVEAYNSDTIEMISRYNNRGVIYRLLGDYELAEEYLDLAVSQALSLFYGFTGIKMNLGVVQSDQFYADNAMSLYDEAMLDLEDDYSQSVLIPQIEFNRAWEYYTANHFEEATEHALNTINHPKTNDYLKAKAYALLGAIYYSLEEFKLAKSAFEDAITLDPEGPIGILAEENRQTVSVRPDEIDGHFTLFPQPADNQIFISFNNYGLDKENTHIQIIDLNGQCLYSDSYSPEIEVADLQPGIYILQLSNASWTIVRKLIIAR